VVAIVGQQVRSALGGHFQQEVDLLSLFKDVASDFVQVCTAPDQARHLIDRAVRIACARRSVTTLICPNDVQEADAVEVPEHAHGTIHSGVDFTWPQVVPSEKDLERAAEMLNRGGKIAILIGSGARNAAAEVMEVAERLRGGVAKALLGKDVLPDDLPYVTGQIGLLGTKASYTLMQECDTLLMIGSTFPYSEFLPKEGQARGVQIDIDPTMLSLRYPMDVALVGDAGATLRALLPRRENGRWRETIEKSVRETWHDEEEKARLPATPLNPELMFWELSEHLPEAAMVTVDTGMSTTFVARALKFRQGMKMAVSGTLATMGPAIPYATAAKFAFPNRPVFAFVGDGAMQMLGLNALVTASKYWKRWADPRFIVAVLNNRDLNMVSWELRALGGSPKIPQTQDVPDFDYAAYARLLGFTGLTVSRTDDVVPVWQEALAARQPVVIDVQADPNVIALPPHTTLEQSKNFFEALAKGDPDRRAILRQVYHQMTL
jgi:pyruvate dehydrogenase (quinone)